MRTTGFVAVANADAGTAARDAIEAAVAELARHGPTELAETESPDQVRDVVDGLDGRVLVICGGDGSIHMAVQHLHDAGLLADVDLGLVPLGTGNDLATHLQLPGDPTEAARAAATGAAHTLDLLVDDDGTVCVNALHAGIGADAAERASGLKESMGQAAYPLGALAAGASVQGWDVQVTVDGEELAPSAGRRVLLVAVMNGPTFGGGTAMSPDARPDDGEADVVVCAANGPGERVAFGVALQRGTHLGREDVAFRRGREVVVAGEPIGFNIDGELSGDDVSRRRFRVDPGAWRIRRA